MRRSLLLVLALSGCTELDSDRELGPPIAVHSRLDELGDVGVEIVETVEPWSLEPPIGRRVVVYVTHTFGTICPILAPGTTMSIGDRPLTALTRGGYNALRTPDGQAYWCEAPTFSGSVADQTGPLTLRLTDETLDVSFDLGDMFAPRTATPVGHPDWSFRAGEEILFAWSPASDLRAFDSDARMPGLDLRSRTSPEGVRVTIPAGARASGNLTIRIEDLRVRCGRDCWAYLAPSVTHAATIAP